MLPLRLLSAVPILFSAALGCGSSQPEGGIDPGNPEQVERGELVYRQHCAACHGAELEGQPDWRQRLPTGRLPAPPHDETGHTWHHSDEELVAMIRYGMVPPLAPEGYESDMPAFEGILDEEEMHAVLAFIQSTWPPDVLRIRREMLEQAPP